MPTLNTQISAAWTKIADAADASLLVTWRDPVVVEIATTAADAAPTVNGHRLSRDEAVTRSVLGAGHVWAKTTSGSIPAGIPLVVSK